MLSSTNRLASLDGLADGGTDRDDDGGRRGPYHTCLVPCDAVRHPVDLHEMRRRSAHGDHVQAGPTDGQPALQRTEPVDLDVDHGAVELHAVAVAADLGDGQPVDLPAVAEVDRPTHVVAGARPSAPGRREERSSLHGLLGVVDVDRHLGKGRVRMPGGIGGDTDAHPVQPAGVRGGGNHLGGVQQFQEEGLGRRAATEHDGGFAQRTTQPGERLTSVAPPRDDLRHHRVVVGRDQVAHRDSGVDAYAGPHWEVEQLDHAGCGGEVLFGVLGVESGFHGVAELCGRLTDQAPTASHVQLHFDQVEPGRCLGHRVLHLQAGVDLQERERPLGGLVEELHRAGAYVPGGGDQRDGGAPQLRVLLLGQDR